MSAPYTLLGIEGIRFGPYEVISPLGAGGMGEVYRARDTRLGREVALKVIAAPRVGDTALEERFMREARVIASLSHPNILTLFDFGIDAGRSYAVMELVEGETLRVHAAAGKVPWTKAVDIGACIADGVAAAHARGVVHRDLKPENVMITTDGRVKILDFGLARHIPSIASASADTEVQRGGAAREVVTEAGTVLGTYGYMSPEQARGDVALAAADLFSIGCILYELVTGRRAFTGGTSAEVLASVLRDDPADVRSISADVPPDLSRLIHRCLEKSPDERLQSARDLTIHLRGILSTPAGTSISSASRRATIPSIAICPFANVSGDPEADYLSDGIAASINGSLSRLPNLRVMSRATMSRYKGSDIDPIAVGRQLGVRALLTGRVLHRGETLSVRLELASTEDGSVLWSENYQRKWSDILMTEEEIALALFERLRVRIAGEDAAKLHRHASDNPEAYLLFLKGRFHCEKRTADGLRKGIAHYHEAIEHDPGYALAYAGIAEAYNLLGFYMHLIPSEAFPRARGAAMKALALDPMLADAHCARAYTYFYYEWDWQNAEAAFRRAIELDPALANVRQFYGAYLLTMNRFQEAFAQIASAEDLDPLGLPVKTAKGWFLFLTRRFEEGVAELRKTIEMDPSFATAHQVMGWCLAMSGRVDEAVEHFRTIASDPDAPTFYRSSLAHVLALSGCRDEAEAIRVELVTNRARRYVSPVQLAVMCGVLQDHDRAFHYLDEALHERTWQLVMLDRDARLDVLRKDPRFHDLLKDLRLTAG